MQLSYVVEAAVIGVPDPDRDEEVKAYIILRDGHDTKPVADVLNHCRENLAPFKVPRYVEFVANFPLTASGKIAKTELKKERPDLRVGAYDAVDDVWREQTTSGSRHGGHA